MLFVQVALDTKLARKGKVLADQALVFKLMMVVLKFTERKFSVSIGKYFETSLITLVFETI